MACIGTCEAEETRCGVSRKRFGTVLRERGLGIKEAVPAAWLLALDEVRPLGGKSDD